MTLSEYLRIQDCQTECNRLRTTIANKELQIENLKKIAIRKLQVAYALGTGASHKQIISNLQSNGDEVTAVRKIVIP
jgi:hypothetical protein